MTDPGERDTIPFVSGILGPGYVDFSLEFRRAGDPDPYVVTWAVEIETPPFTQTGVDNQLVEFVSRFESLFPNDCTIGPLTARIGQDGDPLVLVADTLDQGTNTSDFTTQNVALLVQKRSDFGGRRNRGRMFMPGVPESAVNEIGELTSTYRNAVQGLLDDWLENLQAGGALNTSNMVILHSSAPSTPTVVTSLTCDSRVATQRRRLR